MLGQYKKSVSRLVFYHAIMMITSGLRNTDCCMIYICTCMYIHKYLLFLHQEERKRKKEEEERKKREMRAEKMAEFEKWKNPPKPNFVIQKRDDGGVSITGEGVGCCCCC